MCLHPWLGSILHHSFQGKKVTLPPLSPKEVNEDKKQIFGKRKEEKIILSRKG